MLYKHFRPIPRDVTHNTKKIKSKITRYCVIHWLEWFIASNKQTNSFFCSHHDGTNTILKSLILALNTHIKSTFITYKQKILVIYDQNNQLFYMGVNNTSKNMNLRLIWTHMPLLSEERLWLLVSPFLVFCTGTSMFIIYVLSNFLFHVIWW